MVGTVYGGVTVTLHPGPLHSTLQFTELTQTIGCDVLRITWVVREGVIVAYFISYGSTDMYQISGKVWVYP